jgi:hypothetical protein
MGTVGAILPPRGTDMRRSRSVLAAVLCACFLVRSTGAADFAPVLARGMMLPPPGRMAPQPTPAPAQPAKRSVKPEREPWLASAAVVARWAGERLSAALAAPAAVEERPSDESLASYSFAAANELAAVASLPAPEPPADRSHDGRSQGLPGQAVRRL